MRFFPELTFFTAVSPGQTRFSLFKATVAGDERKEGEREKRGNRLNLLRAQRNSVSAELWAIRTQLLHSKT